MPSVRIASFVFLIGIVFGFAGGAYFVKTLWVSEKLMLEEEKAAFLKQTSAKIAQLEMEKSKNEEIIRGFSATHNPVRVQLPRSDCKRFAGTAGSVQETARDESLPNPAQQAFDRYAKGTGDDALEADLAINDCRVMQSFLLEVMQRK